MAGTASAQEQTVSFLVDCPVKAPHQICKTTYDLTVTTGSRLQVIYAPGPLHCSVVRVHFSLDGQQLATSPWIGWYGAPAPFDTLPLDSGIIELTPVLAGTHVLSLQAEGQVAGCNRGRIVSWGGTLQVILPPRIVAIDVKPDSRQNPINIGSNGTITFAILGDADFDVRTVDISTVTLASAPVALRGNGEPMASYEDVNGDGFEDLLLHVDAAALVIDEDTTSVTMRGRTDVEEIEGTDAVKVK